MTAVASSDLFVHHVLFYMKPTASDADRVQLLAGLQQMRAIPAIQWSHIGTPATTDRAVIDRTYAYSWLCVFASAADELSYQEHPIHDTFRQECAGYWDKVVIYDSEGAASGTL